MCSSYLCESLLSTNYFSALITSFRKPCKLFLFTFCKVAFYLQNKLEKKQMNFHRFFFWFHAIVLGFSLLESISALCFLINAPLLLFLKLTQLDASKIYS